jgi:hypothetical protein
MDPNPPYSKIVCQECGRGEVPDNCLGRRTGAYYIHYWLPGILMLITIASLSIALSKESSLGVQSGEDLTGFAPKFRHHIITFKPDVEFVPDEPADFLKPEIKQKWLSIVPSMSYE